MNTNTNPKGFTMNRIFVAVALAFALLAPAAGVRADAVPPSYGSTAPCPGPYFRAAAQNAMFCYATSPARAEGPYFVNYVNAEATGPQEFCHRLLIAPGIAPECHPYWPFVNPTINAHLAPATAFVRTAPDPVLVAAQVKIDRLEFRLARKQARIERLVERLHSR